MPGEAKGPLKRGIGVACGKWGGGGRPQCVVTVNISRDGSVEVLSGSQDLGTGTRTYQQAIVAEELGLAPEQVVQKLGNSKLGPANASGGSTTFPSSSILIFASSIGNGSLSASAALVASRARNSGV